MEVVNGRWMISATRKDIDKNPLGYEGEFVAQNHESSYALL
jgi:hypothetical protein